MSQIRALKEQILVDGQDLCIDDEDVVRIRECLPLSGPIAREDLYVLTQLRAEARAVCPSFDQLFFPAFKKYILADGTISLEEQFLILRVLYGGGGIDDAERQFLRELRKEARQVSPEFERMYAEAMRSS